MKTPQQIRRDRLESDYEEMVNIRGRIIDWRPTRGTPPHVEGYTLTVRVRTVVDPAPKYRDLHELSVQLPPEYPSKPPLISMLSRPVPFHLNWFVNGNWCFGTWDVSERLGAHILRMIRTLQFDSEITNEHSPANGAARDWYVKNRNRGLFPTDRQELPDPTKRRLEILPQKKKFEIV